MIYLSLWKYVKHMCLPSDTVNYWIFFTNVCPCESWLTDYNLSLLAIASQTDCICIGSSLLYFCLFVGSLILFSRNSAVYWYDREIVWKTSQYNIIVFSHFSWVEPVLHSQFILWLCKHTTSGKCSVEPVYWSLWIQQCCQNFCV